MHYMLGRTCAKSINDVPYDLLYGIDGKEKEGWWKDTKVNIKGETVGIVKGWKLCADGRSVPKEFYNDPENKQ